MKEKLYALAEENKTLAVRQGCFFLTVVYNPLIMSISQIISIGQIIISVLVVIAILLQQRGSGIGGAFGGGGASYYTKRGLEKILFISTIILGILFVGSTIAALLFR